jgi:hypothetical protein
MTTTEITFAPAAPTRWPDIEAVIGACGDARQCWCACSYRPHADYRHGRRDGSNGCWLQGETAGGAVPGVLAYWDGRPIVRLEL